METMARLVFNAKLRNRERQGPAMLREISEEVRVNLKDRLREARQSIRRRRHDIQPATTRPRPPFPFNEIEGLLGHAVSAFDDVMTMAETLAPRRLGGRPNTATARSFDVYFPARDVIAGERAFRRDLYALARAVLAMRRLDGAQVSETGLATLHAIFAREQAGPLADLARASAWTDRIALAATLSAALLVELVRQQPLRFEKAADGSPERETVIACLAPLALTCGLATMEAGNPPETDLLEIAALAVDARMERILTAFAGKEVQGDLTALFATLLAHLP
jgi:hypothetical protein